MAFEVFAAARGARFHWAALVALVACGNEPVTASAGGAANAGGSAQAGASASGGAAVGGRAAGGAAGAASGSGAGGSASGAAGAGQGGATAGGQGGNDSGGAGGVGNVGGSAGSGGVLLVGSGSLSYERWDALKGEAVTLVPVNDPPTVTMTLTKFQMPDDVGLDFGARVRGFLTAPVTGEYTFFISCDDNGELNLSSDETPANKQRIAYVSGSPAWTDYVEWNKFPTQKSAPVSLVAGKRYYVEALLKEDIAEDHLAVGWLKPGQQGTLPSEIVPGEQLSPFK